MKALWGAAMRGERRSAMGIDSQALFARIFVESKGRAPASLEEFVAWLIEFQHLEGDALNNSADAFMEHLKFCTTGYRP